MSFFKKLFGLGGGASSEPVSDTHEYNGYVIRSTPMKEGGQFQVCGVISKDIDGTIREYKFIRVDRFTDRQTCEELTLQKAKQIIHEQGDKIFG
jgi:hypothetical protein